MKQALRPTPPPAVPTWQRRGAVAAGCAAVLLAALARWSGASFPLLAFRLLTDGVLVLLWLCAAAGYGSWVVRRIVPSSKSSEADGSDGALRRVSGLAMGIGFTGLVVLALGLLGWLNRATAFGILIVGVGAMVLALSRLKMTRQDVGGWLGGRAAPAAWVWAAVMPLLGYAIVAALVPPGVLWPEEPSGYDVVEYHLQVPREWFEAGRIGPLRHNVFSYLPANVEAHYLLAMHLRGGPWAGMYLAQFMSVAFVALAAWAAYAAARAIAPPAVASGAAALAAGVPWMTLLAPVAYVEGAQLLFGTLAIGWALRGGTRAMGVAGAMAGLAAGAKLSGVPMLLAALPAAGVVAWVFHRRQMPPPVRRLAAGWAMFLLVGLLVLSPWLARNMAWAGNPVFPQATSLLGRGHFTADQARRWDLSLSPRPDQRPIAGRLRALWEQVVSDWRYGYILLALGAIAAALAWRDARGVFLITFGLILGGIWLGFTHLQGRFLVLAIPAAGLLVARARWRHAGLVVVAIAVAQAIVTAATIDGRAPRSPEAGGASIIDYLAAHELLGTEAPLPVLAEELERRVAGAERVALVGEGKAFLYRVPISRLRYRTVFDVDAASGSVVTAWLGGRREPGEVVVIFPSELRRFAWRADRGTGYWGIPAPGGMPDAPFELLDRR